MTDEKRSGKEQAREDTPNAAAPLSAEAGWKVVVTPDWIECYGFDATYQESARKSGLDFSCRTASHEQLAWAIKRIGEELQKSAAYYRVGNPSDAGRVVID